MLRWLWVMSVLLLFACGGNDDASKAGTSKVPGATQKAQTFTWKMVTTWPKNFPALGTAAEKFAKLVTQMSNGRFTIKVYGAGELVKAFGVFDAVSANVAQLGHGSANYWRGKVPESVFFTSVPFGLTGQEMNAWLNYGGGLELWRKVYAKHSLYPIPAGNTGVQMAGWFNKEITSVDSLRGLKMRIPGLGGEVFTHAGGESVLLPGDEIFTSLQTGVIDAAEWVGPYNDLAFGLYAVARYYYYPGWHEPGSTLETIVNLEAFETLPPDLKIILETACKAINQDMLDEFTARNQAALKTLVEEHGVELRKLPDDVLDRLYDSTQEVLKSLAASSPDAHAIYESMKAFQKEAMTYGVTTEEGYLQTRTRIQNANQN